VELAPKKRARDVTSRTRLVRGSSRIRHVSAHRKAVTPFNFRGYVCGGLLSRAHARSGDVARIAGYCGAEPTLDRALADSAEAYGDQTERDHAELVQAIKRGRVESANLA